MEKEIEELERRQQIAAIQIQRVLREYMLRQASSNKGKKGKKGKKGGGGKKGKKGKK